MHGKEKREEEKAKSAEHALVGRVGVGVQTDIAEWC